MPVNFARMNWRRLKFPNRSAQRSPWPSPSSPPSLRQRSLRWTRTGSPPPTTKNVPSVCQKPDTATSRTKRRTQGTTAPARPPDPSPNTSARQPLSLAAPYLLTPRRSPPMRASRRTSSTSTLYPIRSISARSRSRRQRGRRPLRASSRLAARCLDR